MRKTITTFLLLLITICSAEAQRMPFFTHYYNNPYLYNPAYAGYDKHAVFYLTHRQQWYGVEGAPMSTQLSFHSPMGNANPLFVGADITDDRLGALTHNAVKFSLAYLIPLSSEHEHYIKTAFSAGLGMHSYDWGSMDIGDDLVLQAALGNQTYLDGRFGFRYHNRGFNLSVALPHLFTPPPVLTDGFGDIELDQFSRMIFSTHYRFNFNEQGTTAFEPTILYHYSQLGSSQLEVLGIFYFNDTFWAGGGYQQQSGISGTAGFKIKNFKFSYAYSTGGSEISAYGIGSHELQLGLIIGKKKVTLKRKPRLSTKNTIDDIPDKELLEKHAKSREKTQRKEEKLEKEEIPDRKKVTPPAEVIVIENDNTKAVAPQEAEGETQNTEPVEAAQVQTVETIKTQSETPASTYQGQAKAVQTQTQKPAQQKNYDNLKFDSFDSSDTNKGVIQLGENQSTKPKTTPSTPATLANPPATESSTPAQKQAEEEKKAEDIGWGDAPFEDQNTSEEEAHPLALKGGFYIIAGTFSTQANAEKMVNKLSKQGFSSAVGYHAQKQYYYVHLFQSEDKNQALSELEKLKNNTDFKQSWILTVEP